MLLFIGNSIMYLGWESIFSGLALEIYTAISDVVLMIDLCTWHIHGLFAVISFIVKVILLWGKKIKPNAYEIINVILHFIFSTVSFYEIWFIFENSF